MNALLLLIALLGTPAAAEAGKIHGVVTAEPSVKPKAGGGGAYADHSLAGAAPFDYKRLKNVVVYAEPAEGTPAGPDAETEVSVIKGRYGLELLPRFAVVRAGNALRWRNTTGELVHVYAGGARALGAALEPGKSVAVNVDAAAGDSFRLYCMENMDAGAMLMVSGPYFSLAGGDGRYALELQPGRYKITAWHYRLPMQTQDVEVTAGGDKALDFKLSVKRLQEVP